MSLTPRRDSLEKRRRERALLEAQAEEIARAQLQAGEEEELKARKNILAHAEKLHQGCREGEELLYEGEAALVGRLGKYAGELRELAAIDPNLQPTLELIDSSLAQLQEAAAQLRRYAEPCISIRGRWNKSKTGWRKSNGSSENTTASVDEHAPHARARSENRLDDLEQGEEQIAALEKAFAAARRSAWDFAEKLSNDRQRAAKKLKREHGKRGPRLGHG